MAAAVLYRVEDLSLEICACVAKCGKTTSEHVIMRLVRAKLSLELLVIASKKMLEASLTTATSKNVL